MIKNSFLKITLAILVLFVFASLAMASQMPQEESLAKHVIPLHLDRKMTGMPIIDVKIGDVVLPLALDTGANNVFIAIIPEALEKLPVTSSLQIQKNMDVDGNVYHSKSFILPQITLGNLKLENVLATEELRVSPDESQGIIGNKLFENYNVLLDYQASTMTLYSNKQSATDLDLKKWKQMPFKHEDIGIILEASLGKVTGKLRFCLDTGAIAVDEQGKAFDMLKKELVKTQNRPDSQAIYTDKFMADGQKLGKLDFYLVDFAEPPVDGFLGYNFLQHYQTFIDFPNQMLYLKPYNKK